ncbi:MAG: prepilin-type N-terminal cleavage/methylation domain-containing protein [Gemmatimonadaceae bacterium]|nr:prepilin-type N-terminal cleavage/methylation domain-containing protein [Gemmatimonadaceae bacterium]
MKKTARRGFTLAEVLVTLAIIAIMAAVLLPALNSQIGKGDAGRVASDLTNIQTGAQAFLSDVHRYPKSLTDLTTAITASNSDLLGNTYPSTLAAKWKGPYVQKDAVSPSGIGTFVTNFLQVTGSNAIPYLSVQLTGVSPQDYARIEDLLDEGNLSSTSSTSGLIRFNSASTTLTYLALPIQ